MVIEVILNKYNYIEGYATFGGLGDSIKIEIEDKFNFETLYEYQYLNKKLIHNPPTEKPIGIKLEYDGNIWIETATIEEQREYWLNKILEVNKEIEQYKILGFEGRKELIDLENKLQKYKLKYSATFEDEAIKMDKHIQSIKPIK